ncbi:hypothetical protein CLF_101884 [Clonorchis sinensis]|uniref:Uncharacterized protein n=1 Tax=Clonorchis sinensis TaxID=79923 RepID=G7Y6S6_CLOSI|nr:hypothetical protein CLF_101884 [Clonorchis sinensis]
MTMVTIFFAIKGHILQKTDVQMPCGNVQFSDTGMPRPFDSQDAREEASLRWTQCVEYVELSALLSVTDDKVVAQDLDSQNHKPDHSEPETPAHTQLAKLIAGDSDVHANTEERRLRPKKPLAIQENYWLAGLQVKSSAKIGLVGMPPKKNYFSVLLPNAQGLTETPFRSNRVKSLPKDDHFVLRTLEQIFFSYHLSHLLLLGDFNAANAPWTELQCVEPSGLFAAALTKFVQLSSLTQRVIAPTRYCAPQLLSLLDLVITNKKETLLIRCTAATERQEHNLPGKLGQRPRACVSICESTSKYFHIDNILAGTCTCTSRAPFGFNAYKHFQYSEATRPPTGHSSDNAASLTWWLGLGSVMTRRTMVVGGTFHTVQSYSEC